ncbi:MAG: helix-turn-helix transcriptional regulator [bacterium]|nr:helix-turn-helix transcriptional regulator [bacterium]
MKDEIKTKIEDDLSFTERYPKFRKTRVGLLTYTIINECELEDLKYLNLGWVARTLRVSESYVTKCYKDIFQQAPRVLFLRKKMAFARELLVNCPDLSIAEVAEKLEYNSSDYFIKVFKANNSRATPLQYRKDRRIENEAESVLKKLARKFQIALNRTINEATNGEYPDAVYVHGGYGKLKRKNTGLVEFMAPGYDFKNPQAGAPICKIPRRGENQ